MRLRSARPISSPPPPLPPFAYLRAPADVVHSLFLAVPVPNLDLVLVDGDPRDVRPREPRYVPHRPPHAAPDVDALLGGGEPELEGEEVLGAVDGLGEGLVGEAGGEVEGLTPTVLVEVRHEVVEGGDHVLVLVGPEWEVGGLGGKEGKNGGEECVSYCCSGC